MKLTKLGHSCVLIETDDRTALFDAGVWSDAFDIDKIEHVDRIVYTHEHADHLDMSKLKQLVEKFPAAHVICNPEIRALIEAENIDVMIREDSACTTKFTSPHEKLPIPGSTPPTENGYHFRDLFTHPGDSHSFTESKKVLAMPFIAPWGKTGDAVDKVIELAPEYVIPIHDWHYTDEARAWLEGLLTTAFEGHNIKLLSSDSGVTHEIN